MQCNALMRSLLPRALSRELDLKRMIARIRAYKSSNLDGVPQVIEETADIARIDRLWTEVKPDYEKDAVSAAKYADRRTWIYLNIERAARIGLHQSSNLRILDIGCGPGYFMATAQALGHECHGVDVPESYFTPVERRVYSELLEALRCRARVSPLLIAKFAPLPFPDGRFDLITAFWICFNRHRQADEWGVKEWRFWIEDARRCLRPSGRIFLELNEHHERFGDLRFYDRETLEYFRSTGVVDGGRVVIQTQ